MTGWWVLIWLGCSACAAAERPPGPARDPPPAHGILEGTIRDAVTGAALPTVTVVAFGDGLSPGEAEHAYDGRYALRLEPGAWQLAVLLDGDAIEVAVQVPPDRTTHHDILVPSALARAARRREVFEHALCPPAPPARSTSDRAEVAAAVLARVAARPSAIVDGGLVPARPPVPLVIRPRAAPDLLPSGLPPDLRAHLAVRTRVDLQRAADDAHATLHFLELDGVDVRGDCAEVTMGVGMVTPTQSSRVHLCCCSEVQRWERRAGEWVFRYRIITSCA